MIIYNKTILSFQKRLRQKAREILANECGLKVARTRFSFGSYSYPLQIVIFENPKLLGYFEPAAFTIGINKELITSTHKKIVHDVLRHEIAHYICFLKFGMDDTPHGQNFKNICREYNWGSDIWAAKVDLNIMSEKLEGDIKTQGLMNKVEKLLALGSSTNVNEANLATQKANELLLKYNLTLSASDEEQDYYLKSVLKFKKRNPKLEALYDILSQFFVKPVLSYTQEGVRLDLFGTKTNIEFAEYVAHYLDHHLDLLWLQTKKEMKLSGLRQKNSFFRGIAKGFKNKELTAEADFALIGQELNMKFNHYFNGRTYSSSHGQVDKTAEALGRKKGQSLVINPGIKTQKTILALE